MDSSSAELDDISHGNVDPMDASNGPDTAANQPGDESLTAETISEDEVRIARQVEEVVKGALGTPEIEELSQRGDENLCLAATLAALRKEQEKEQREQKNPVKEWLEKHPRLYNALKGLGRAGEFAAPIAIGLAAAYAAHRGLDPILVAPLSTVIAAGASRLATTTYRAFSGASSLYKTHVLSYERARGPVKLLARVGLGGIDRAVVESIYGGKSRAREITTTLNENNIQFAEDGKLVSPTQELVERLGALPNRGSFVQSLALQGLLTEFYDLGKAKELGEVYARNYQKALGEIFLVLVSQYPLEEELNLLSQILNSAYAEKRLRVAGTVLSETVVGAFKGVLYREAGQKILNWLSPTGVAAAELPQGLQRADLSAQAGLPAPAGTTEPSLPETRYLQDAGSAHEVVAPSSPLRPPLSPVEQAPSVDMTPQEFPVGAQVNPGDTSLDDHPLAVPRALAEENIELPNSEAINLREAYQTAVEDHGRLISEINSARKELALADHLAAYDAYTVEAGSTIGHQVLEAFRADGVTDVSIWEERASTIWYYMLLKNQGAFSQKALAMAEALGPRGYAFLAAAEKWGLRPDGTFDPQKLEEMRMLLRTGNEQTRTELLELFHWIRAGDQISVVKNVRELLPEASHIEPSQYQEQYKAFSGLVTQLKDLEDKMRHLVGEFKETVEVVSPLTPGQVELPPAPPGEVEFGPIPETPVTRVIERSPEFSWVSPRLGPAEQEIISEYLEANRGANNSIVELGRGYHLFDPDTSKVYSPTLEAGKTITDIIEASLEEQGVRIPLTEGDLGTFCAYLAAYEGNTRVVLDALRENASDAEYIALAEKLGFFLDPEKPFRSEIFEEQILAVRYGDEEAIRRFITLFGRTKNITLPKNWLDLIPLKTTLTPEEAKLLETEFRGSLSEIREAERKISASLAEAPEGRVAGIKIPPIDRGLALGAGAAAGVGLGAFALRRALRRRREAAPVTAPPPTATPEEGLPPLFPPQEARPEPITPPPPEAPEAEEEEGALWELARELRNVHTSAERKAEILEVVGERAQSAFRETFGITAADVTDDTEAHEFLRGNLNTLGVLLVEIALEERSRETLGDFYDAVSAFLETRDLRPRKSRAEFVAETLAEVTAPPPPPPRPPPPEAPAPPEVPPAPEARVPLTEVELAALQERYAEGMEELAVDMGNFGTFTREEADTVEADDDLVEAGAQLVRVLLAFEQPEVITQLGESYGEEQKALFAGLPSGTDSDVIRIRVEGLLPMVREFGSGGDRAKQGIIFEHLDLSDEERDRVKNLADRFGDELERLLS